MLAGTSNEELVDFVGAKFYRPHALADGTSAFGLGRRCWLCPQQCYLHCLYTRQLLFQLFAIFFQSVHLPGVSTVEISGNLKTVRDMPWINAKSAKNLDRETV